jgi:hypothetical protein
MMEEVLWTKRIKKEPEDGKVEEEETGIGRLLSGKE